MVLMEEVEIQVYSLGSCPHPEVGEVNKDLWEGFVENQSDSILMGDFNILKFSHRRRFSATNSSGKKFDADLNSAG